MTSRSSSERRHGWSRGLINPFCLVTRRPIRNWLIASEDFFGGPWTLRLRRSLRAKNRWVEPESRHFSRSVQRAGIRRQRNPLLLEAAMSLRLRFGAAGVAL